MDWRRLAAVAMAAALAVPAAAQDAARPHQVYADKHGVAANGFDVVAYFDNQAARGIPGIEVEYLGVTWYFETQDNADRFQRDPDRYVPRFGGFCAYGVAQGYLVGTDPHAWSIIDGQLYLNYNQPIRTRWLANTERYVALGERHWPRLSEVADGG